MTENIDATRSLPETREQKYYLPEYSTKDLKKIHFRSESIKLVAALIIMSTITIAYEGFMIGKYLGKDVLIRGITKPMNVVMILVNILCFVGLITRTQWGRIVGLLTCAMWIVSPIWVSRFSIFIVFGIWGLWVLVQSANLFGPDRILSKELKAELKRRKEQKVA